MIFFVLIKNDAQLSSPCVGEVTHWRPNLVDHRIAKYGCYQLDHLLLCLVALWIACDISPSSYNFLLLHQKGEYCLFLDTLVRQVQ